MIFDAEISSLPLYIIWKSIPLKAVFRLLYFGHFIEEILISILFSAELYLVLAVGFRDLINTERCPGRWLLQTHHELPSLGWTRIMRLVASLWFVFVNRSWCATTWIAGLEIWKRLTKILRGQTSWGELIGQGLIHFVVLPYGSHISQPHAPRVRTD